MNDEPDSPRQSSHSSAIVVIIVVLPLCYVLSIGPVAYLMDKFHAPTGWKRHIGTFYHPVIWLHDNTSLKEPLEAYARWWGDLMRR